MRIQFHPISDGVHGAKEEIEGDRNLCIRNVGCKKKEKKKNVGLMCMYVKKISVKIVNKRNT